MDALSDRRVEQIVIMSSAQVGKTEVINNVVGFHIDQDPAPILLVMPTLELGEAYSKDRLAPMLRDSPCLHGKVKDPRSRDSGNTLLHKSFPGGHITIAGANSPASLSSRPVRIVLCDEVDRFPPSAGAEGDPVNLARKRSTTFWNRKSVLVSTPTLAGISRIENAFETSDRRFFFVPCPDCEEMQTLDWAQVKWSDNKPETAAYCCKYCGCLWNDAKRWRAVRKGKWIAAAEFNGIAGFHLSELYSSWVKLTDTVAEFLKAKDHPEKLKTWVNTALGQTWQEKGEAPEWQRLYDRREDYPTGRIPRGGLFLTAGVDVQKDRLEVQLVAWGRNRENWSIDYIVIDGDTSRLQTFDKLDELLNTRFKNAAGTEFAIARLAIDSGYATQEVYTWARRHRTGRVMVCKGHDRFAAAPVGQPKAVDISYQGKKIARGMRVFPVAFGIYKSELYGWLRLDRPTIESGDPFPPGYCHFPQYQDEFFKQLTAEQLLTRTVRGYKKLEWQKTRARNEALDNWLLARAAAALFGLDRFGERQWRQLEAPLSEIEKSESQPLQSQEQVKPAEPSKQEEGSVQERRRRGTWLNNRSGWLKKK